jgi:hypothetical protein
MITLNSAVTNNADWRTIFQWNDIETGDLIDFTGASIEIELREPDNYLYSNYGNYGFWIQASTDNGLITIISLGIFELVIPKLQMQNLCPGSYPIGGVYTLNDETISLFTGSLTVKSGNSRL